MKYCRKKYALRLFNRKTAGHIPLSSLALNESNQLNLNKQALRQLLYSYTGTCRFTDKILLIDAIKGSKILVLGIAYKKNVDDMRESPSVEVMDRLHALGADISYADPHVPVFP